MLKDVIYTFEPKYKMIGEKFITDNYDLGIGSYILLKKDGTYEEPIEITKDFDKSNSNYRKLCNLDYLSRITDTNKSVDRKKIILSNNYLAFIGKKDKLKEKIKNKEIHKIVKNFYKTLENPSEKYSGKTLELYNKALDKYGKSNLEDLNFVKNWIENNLENVLNEVKDDKNYIKIFLDLDIEEYERESNKYIIPNNFNKNDYNIKINDYIFGLPNDNMSLNAKKPYLEHKTRKNSIPYLISEEEAMLQKKFFDHLYNNLVKGKSNVYIDEDLHFLNNEENIDRRFSGYYLKLKKGKEVEILDFDTIVDYNPHLEGFFITMPIDIDYKEKKDETLSKGPILELKDLQRYVDKIFFNKFLINNYFAEPKDITLNDNKIKEALLKYRKGFFDWFFKGNNKIVRGFIDNMSLNLIKNSIIKGFYLRAKEQFNLRVAFLEYFKGGDNMADKLKKLSDILEEKINSKETQSFNNDEEYYFGVGQVVSYLISLNRSSKKMHSLINPILNSRNDERLKNEIKKLFIKYNYTIEKHSKRFNNLYAMIEGYVPNKDINQDMLIAGYLHSSLIYKKDKEEEN